MLFNKICDYFAANSHTLFRTSQEYNKHIINRIGGPEVKGHVTTESQDPAQPRQPEQLQIQTETTLGCGGHS